MAIEIMFLLGITISWFAGEVAQKLKALAVLGKNQRFRSQQQHGGSQTPIAPVLGGLICSFLFCHDLNTERGKALGPFCWMTDLWSI